MAENLLETMKAYAALHHVPILLEPSAEILQQEVRLKCPRRVLEIGTAIGYSGLLMAQEMTTGGHLISIDTDCERQTIASQFIKQAQLAVEVELITGDACEIILQLGGTFDFVFIDAAKGQYVNYLSAVLPLLTTGAVIVADNVLFRGWVESGIPSPRRYKTIVHRLQKYLAIVRDPKLFTTQTYTCGDGVAVSIYQGNQEIL